MDLERSSLLEESISTTSTTSKDEECELWHKQLLVEFTSNISENINIRLDAVETIVNLGFPHSFQRFQIQRDLRNEIMEKIEPEIDEKTKVQHKACSKPINDIKDYRNVARNRLNRNKPKFLGNFVFAEIIFNKLYPFIYKQCKLNKLPNIMVMKYFLTILISIFENHAIFTQTKPQPIITYNTLVNENLFKSACINLLKLYGISQSLYITEKKKKKTKQTQTQTQSTSNKKGSGKRDKAKMAYYKIVNAIKLINNDQMLRSRDIPSCIITSYDTRKNITYDRLPITPPAREEKNNDVDAAFFGAKNDMMYYNNNVCNYSNNSNSNNNNGCNYNNNHNYGNNNNNGRDTETTSLSSSSPSLWQNNINGQTIQIGDSQTNSICNVDDSNGQYLEANGQIIVPSHQQQQQQPVINNIGGGQNGMVFNAGYNINNSVQTAMPIQIMNNGTNYNAFNYVLNNNNNNNNGALNVNNINKNTLPPPISYQQPPQQQYNNGTQYIVNNNNNNNNFHTVGQQSQPQYVANNVRMTAVNRNNMNNNMTNNYNNNNNEYQQPIMVQAPSNPFVNNPINNTNLNGNRGMNNNAFIATTSNNGYGASRGRDTTNNVSSTRYSPFQPQPTYHQSSTTLNNNPFERRESSVICQPQYIVNNNMNNTINNNDMLSITDTNNYQSIDFRFNNNNDSNNSVYYNPNY